MAKGGTRPGAGRPKGSKDGKLRNKKKQLPVGKKDPNPNLPVKSSYLQMEKYLSAENRKLYRNLISNFESPRVCLKAIRDDLVARYNLGRIGEMEEVSYLRKLAKDGLKEISEKETLDGRALTIIQKAEEIKKLKRQLKTYPQLSSKVTSLAGEIRQVNELIDRIESGRPDKVINLFNILAGNASPEKTSELREKVFDIGENDDEVEEGEIKENTE